MQDEGPVNDQTDVNDSHDVEDNGKVKFIQSTGKKKEFLELRQKRVIRPSNSILHDQ